MPLRIRSPRALIGISIVVIVVVLVSSWYLDDAPAESSGSGIWAVMAPSGSQAGKVTPAMIEACLLELGCRREDYRRVVGSVTDVFTLAYPLSKGQVVYLAVRQDPAAAQAPTVSFSYSDITKSAALEADEFAAKARIRTLALAEP